ncbi:hypothetical protein Ancab_022568 [Ancistrocladus abbreviatus]
METSWASESLAEFIRKEVPDWDDEVKATARFKAFSGQISDWEPQFRFWRDLIIKIANHFGCFILSPLEMKNHWFSRGGMTPLCLDHVLGVKLSLTSAAVSGVTSLDCDILQLIWTTEKLQQQLDVIDQRCQVSRKSALAALKSGNKKAALRHAKEHRSTCENRENFMLLLNRVEEVLHGIIDMESTRKVSEAMHLGARAMKENRLNGEELQQCLQEVDENFYFQGEFNKALESSSNADAEDDDIVDELRELEMEIRAENLLVLSADCGKEVGTDVKASGSADSLGDAMSALKLECS